MTKSKQIVLDLKNKKLAKSKIGAFIMEGSEDKLVSAIPLAKALGLQVIYYNLLSGAMNDATAAMVVSFAQATGVKIIIYYPVCKNPDPPLMDWIVKTFGSLIEYVQLDTESISNPGGITNAQYIAFCQALMARYPLLQYGWDAGLIYRYTDRLQVARNAALSTLKAPPTRARQYAQICPDIKVFGTDQNANLVMLKDYYANLFPHYLNGTTTEPGFKQQLPHLISQDIVQYHNSDSGAPQLSTPLSNWSNGEMVRSVLSNTESYSSLIYMQFASLVSRGIASLEYNSWKRFTPAFKLKYVVPLTISIDGVTGVGLTDGANQFGMILNSSASVANTITTSDIKIYGKTISGLITRDSGWSAKVDGVVTNEIVADSQILIHPFSSNRINFTTSVSS